MQKSVTRYLLVAVSAVVSMNPRLVFAAEGTERKPLDALAVSPDGTHAAVGGNEGVVRIWELRGGREVQTIKVGHTIFSLAFGPEGKTLTAATDGHGLRLWKKSDGRFGGEQSFAKPERGLCVAFSPDGHILAAGAQGAGSIFLYDLRTDKKGLLWEPSNLISKLEFSPDGKSLASAGGNFKRWDVHAVWQRGLTPEFLDRGVEELRRQMRPAIQWESDYDPEYAADISYAPDGKTLATVTGTGRLYTGGKTLSVWDVATGRRLKKIASQGLTTVAFLPGGNAVVTGSDDGAIRVWDVAGSRLEKEWPAHAKAVRSIVIVPGHSQIASVSEDGAFKLWNPETGKLVRELGR